MSIKHPDQLFLGESESFSTARIDETIARSKRIVQECLAMSKQANQEINFKNISSPTDNIDIDNSLKFSFEQFKTINESSIMLEKNHQRDIKANINSNISKVYRKSSIETNEYINELMSKEFTRKKEILRLKNILQTQLSPDILKLEEKLIKKQVKIKELSVSVNNHSLFKENQELEGKIKQYENMNTDRNLRDRILEEKLKKKSLESKYNNLHKIHEEKSNEAAHELRRVISEIKEKEKENQTAILFLQRKLEEQILDNQTIIDNIRPNSVKSICLNDKEEESLMYYTTREAESRKYVNSNPCNNYSDFINKIAVLEAQLKKYKQKYKKVKKLYINKCRRSSMELKKIPSIPQKIDNKSLSKRRMSLPVHNKSQSHKTKDIPQIITD